MMADFLTRLAERAVGIPPNIRPDISPLPGLAPNVDSRSSLPFQRLESPTGVPSAPIALRNMAVQSMMAERPLMDEPLSIGAERTGQSQTGPVSTAATQQKHRLAASGSDDEHSTLAIESSVVESLSSPGNRGQSSVRAKSEAPINQVVISPQARVATSTAIPQPFDKTPSRAPAVQVTIGRVEVRAIMPPSTSAQRPLEQKAAPNMSLEEYLKTRNGRRG
jgi:hypothetical protein